MPLIQLKKDFSCLIRQLGFDNPLKQKINLILEELAIADPYQRTKFEYSLKIEDCQLSKELRFVNYNDSYGFSPDRVDLIENIILSQIKKKTLFLSNFFCTIRKFNQYPLRFYFGLKAKSSHDFFWKIYINYFDLLKEKPRLAIQVINNILKKLELKTKIKMKNSGNLVGFTVDSRGRCLEYKIYHHYDYENKYDLQKLGFSEKEIKLAHWLGQYNKRGYFSITERFNHNKKTFSKKLDIPIYPWVDNEENNLLEQLFYKIGCGKRLPRIQKTIQKTNSKITFIAIEKNKLAVYARLSYGQ